MTRARWWRCVVLDWHPDLEGLPLLELWRRGVERAVRGWDPRAVAREAAAEELGSRMLVLVGRACFVFHVVRAVRTSLAESGPCAFVADVDYRLYDLTGVWAHACAELQVLRFNQRHSDGAALLYFPELGAPRVEAVHLRGRAFLDETGRPTAHLRARSASVPLDQLEGSESDNPCGPIASLTRGIKVRLHGG